MSSRQETLFHLWKWPLRRSSDVVLACAFASFSLSAVVPFEVLLSGSPSTSAYRRFRRALPHYERQTFFQPFAHPSPSPYPLCCGNGFREPPGPNCKPSFPVHAAGRSTAQKIPHLETGLPIGLLLLGFTEDSSLLCCFFPEVRLATATPPPLRYSWRLRCAVG